MTAPEQTQAARPRPAFGEYAPDGWEWKPEGAVAEPAAAGGQGSTPNTSMPGTVPGVPHNLGAGSTLPRKNARAAATQQTGGAPYVGEAPKHPGVHPGVQSAPQPGGQHAGVQNQLAGQGAQAKRPSMADRIITALLLTVGAFGALQSGFAMFGLGRQFAMMADVLGVSDFTAPSWLELTGRIAGIAVLAFYALVLVYSIRRLRSGKLTFWVPLVAGVIVFVIVFIVSIAALTTSPELMQAMSDPESLSKLLAFAETL